MDFSQTFSLSNIVASGSTDSVRLYRVTRSDNTVDEFALLIPGEATQSLSYVTYGQWNSPNGSARDLNLGTLVFGVQTADVNTSVNTGNRISRNFSTTVAIRNRVL